MSHLILFENIGNLLRSYRDIKNLSQLEFADLLQVSLKTIERWENCNNVIKERNIHDIADFTGIPIFVLILLNNSYPIYYNIITRKYYVTQDEIKMKEPSLIKYEEIKKDFHYKIHEINTTTQVEDIIKYDHEIYPTSNSMKKDTVIKAASLLPELNFTLHDKWGHYIGHSVCFPLLKDTYNKILNREIEEGDLKNVDLCANDMINVLYFYSLYSCCIGCSLKIMRKIKSFLKFLDNEIIIAGYSVTKDGNKLCKNLGMNIVFRNIDEFNQYKTEIIPTLWEIKIKDIRELHA